ncbi:hypothetical protein [Fodinibius sp.]|uniref:hypothetical protein n=1 Tax=Fodinibius sp. TaxID=1872440 RepID=UPI002ACE5230|nr:hypothetical protein [Fodinibius sp.]MDZ7660254.1 hypothetical protein [Fodinibius sp.]
MMDSIRGNLKYIFPVLIIIVVTGLVLSRVYQPKKAIPVPEIQISAAEAVNHVGTPAKVCGTVVSADFIREIDGNLTFLNFGQPHPNQLFTAVIWGEERSKWKTPPEQKYKNRQICVTGSIEMHEGTPQIVVGRPEQIVLERKDD